MPDLASRILEAALQEFSDVPDAAQLTRVLVRITVAIVLGALIGYERELHQSAAGLRTHMLVALGAALFVMVPQQAGVSEGDLSRVLQGVIAGVGFLGAGAVLKRDDTDQIRGLTTAAGIWVTAAIGIAVGMGREATAVIGTLAVLLILAVLRRFGRRTAARALDAEARNDGDPPAQRGDHR